MRRFGRQKVSIRCLQGRLVYSLGGYLNLSHDNGEIPFLFVIGCYTILKEGGGEDGT